MRVRLECSFDVGPSTRRLIREHWGKEGLATRDEVKYFFQMYGELGLNNLVRKSEQRAEGKA